MALSPTSSRGAPITRQQLFGLSVNIANNAIGTLTWDGVISGDTLLNRTVLTAPTIVTTGVYCVAVYFSQAQLLTTGGYYRAILDLDLNGEAPQLSASSPAQVAAGLVSDVSLTSVYYLPAGAVIQARVENRDGVATRGFLIQEANLQRLS